MIRSFVFSTQGRLQRKDVDIAGMREVLADPAHFLWVDIESCNEEETRSILEGVFHFHPLSIDDCIHDCPLPKVDEFIPGDDDHFAQHLFMIIHAVDYNRKDGVFATGELDFFLGRNFIVTYHDIALRTIRQIEERCVKGALMVARAPDRVAQVLLDILVENYKPALEELSLEISELEQLALQCPQPETLNKILAVKKEVVHLRRIIGPQRAVLDRLSSGEFKLIRPRLVPYYRDVYDRLSHIEELAQGYADSLTGTLQVYLNMSSNQTGEVVKLLTLITLVTTPLMMIGTWYGMNFKDMPELQYRHGYPIAFALVVISTGATYWYFKKKKWF